jgi:hypothetical protein
MLIKLSIMLFLLFHPITIKQYRCSIENRKLRDHRSELRLVCP